MIGTFHAKKKTQMFGVFLKKMLHTTRNPTFQRVILNLGHPVSPLHLREPSVFDRLLPFCPQVFFFLFRFLGPRELWLFFPLLLLRSGKIRKWQFPQTLRPKGKKASLLFYPKPHLRPILNCSLSLSCVCYIHRLGISFLLFSLSRMWENHALRRDAERNALLMIPAEYIQPFLRLCFRL